MAETIADIWKRDKETIERKSLAQILSFSGEGKLRDSSQTCYEMREFFDLLQNKLKTILKNVCHNHLMLQDMLYKT